MELPFWYGQRDARWSGIKLGFSKTDTIGGYGCLITCIGILVAAFDYPRNQTTPIGINNWLKANGGYVDDDLVVWSAVPRITSMIAQGVSYSGNIAEVANYLNKGNCLAICEVRMNGYMHFVLGYKSKGGDVWVHDPWTNIQRPLSQFGKLYAAHFYANDIPPVAVAPAPVPQPPAQPERIPDLPPVVVVPQEKPTETPVEATIPPTPDVVVVSEEKLNVGLLNSLLQRLLDFINKLMK